MFGLESKTKEQIQKLRSTELKFNRRRKLLGLAFSITNYTLPLLVMVVTFAVFTLVQGGQLVRASLFFPSRLSRLTSPLLPLDQTASKVFSSISVFALFSQALGTIFQISRYIESWVSIQRIDKFLHDTELIDRHTPEDTLALVAAPPAAAPVEQDWIGFERANFAWLKNAPKSAASSDGTASPAAAARNFRLRIEDLKFKKNAINIIAGPTGSGACS